MYSQYTPRLYEDDQASVIPHSTENTYKAEACT